jgi:hypothetical protein
VLKKLREEQEIKARMEFLRREHAAEDEVKRKEAEMRAEAGKMADEAMEKERKKLLKEMEKEWKKKGGKGRQPQLPKERPERVAKIKKEETAKAMEVLKKRERERIDSMIKDEGEKKKAEYEEQVRELSNGNYRGNFMDNKRHGFGVRTYGNGDVYEGLWKDGKREGKGKIVFKNGTVYEVSFAPFSGFTSVSICLVDVYGSSNGSGGGDSGRRGGLFDLLVAQILSTLTRI